VREGLSRGDRRILSPEREPEGETRGTGEERERESCERMALNARGEEREMIGQALNVREREERV
jgi:hypothetical protein